MKVAIAHAEFLPERDGTLARLLEQLAPQGGAEVLRSTSREHASVWATRLWEYAAATRDDVICLNDDTEVSPDLVAACKAIVTHKTSRMVSLHTVHPMARSLAEAGQRYMRTFHLTGPAYLLRKGTAPDLLAYARALPKGFFEGYNEDNWAIQFAFRHREPIWGTLPALVAHDTTVPSSLGYDAHPGRATPVGWREREIFDGVDLADPATWRPEEEPSFLETHWTSTKTLVTNEIAISLGIDPMTCWWCGERPSNIGSDKTGCRLCMKCVHNGVGVMLNDGLRAQVRLAQLGAAPQGGG